MSEQLPSAPAQEPAPEYQPQTQHPTLPTQATGYTNVPSSSAPGSGLAIGSLVVGLIAVLGSWVPVLNLGAIVLAVVGIVLAVLAIRGAKRGSQSGRGMAIAGLVLASLSIVVAIVVNVFAAVFVTSGIDAVEQLEQDMEDQAAGQGVAADENDEAQTAAAEVLGLGEAAQVGDYTVAVTSVVLDGTQLVAEANEFNEPAAHQYVVVDLDVTYEGAVEGDPWIDLMVTFDGADARQYDESTCMATLPNDGTEVPTLTNGGTATYQVCMDVPAEAMDGGTIFVEPTFSMGDERAYWAVR